MTTAREYLDRYNAAAVKLNKPTIKGPWKSSTAAIQVKCNAIETELKTLHPADDMAPKQIETKPIDVLVQKTKAKNKAKIERDAAKTAAKSTPAKFSAAQIIMDFNIDPKQGRALLRKHNVKRTPEAIRAFFKSRQK